MDGRGARFARRGRGRSRLFPTATLAIGRSPGGTKRRPPAVAAIVPRRCCYRQLEAVYPRSVRRAKGGSAVTLARPEGANRAFGQRSPFSAPRGLDYLNGLMTLTPAKSSNPGRSSE